MIEACYLVTAEPRDVHATKVQDLKTPAANESSEVLDVIL